METTQNPDSSGSNSQLYPSNDAPASRDINPSGISDQGNVQEMDQLERELRMTLQEVARLQNALADANMKLMALTSTANAASSGFSAESIVRPLLKELRQPLVTIKGYLELLLNESVGSLGAFQRRFLERIQKAVVHMEDSFDAIVRNNDVEPSERGLFAQSFSVKKTIESSLDLFISTIRSKEITLQINIPNEDTRLFEDRENFEKIMNLLITNATASLPPGSSLSIDISESLTSQPQAVLIKLESSSQSDGQSDLLPVLPEMYKDQAITLPGFGLPLEDIVRANSLAKKMGGKINLRSNSCGTIIQELHLPLVQGEELI
jgi:signal transduction histidine kinase